MPPAPPRNAAPAAQAGPGDSEADPGGLAPLRLQLRNSDLKFVGEPLLVGHYQSQRLTGAERVVDALIGGQMAQSLRLGQYPDAPGTHQVFINQQPAEDPWQLPRPHAVVVVGLGEEGKLRHSELARSVRLAALAMAQRLLEAPGGAAGPRAPRFDLAATLLGSGGAGITAGAAAQQVAQGVRDANEALHRLNQRQRRAGPGPGPGEPGSGSGGSGRGAAPPPRLWPQVGTLHLVELYADRAAEAWRALQALSLALPGQFALAPDVLAGLGALRRPLDGGYRGVDYDFIRAASRPEGPDGGAIDYTLDTQRARSEEHGQSAQIALVRELVARASHDSVQDPQIGRTLFQLLVPPGVAPIFGGSTDLVIELDAGTAGIPWELLDTRPEPGAAPGARPWAIRSKLLRKLRTEQFRAQVADAGTEAGALVVGEPACDRRRYPDLPAARHEARQVARRLGQVLPPGQVQALVRSDAADDPGPDAAEVVNALLSRDWRILHVAGHGEPAEAPALAPAGPGQGQGAAAAASTAAVSAASAAGGAAPAATVLAGPAPPRGVVLDKGTFLGPRELAAMPVVPQLVFLNCCHLGARPDGVLLPDARWQGHDRAQWAASLAEQLIGMGVRCVVVAGWAVEDRPAQVFADTFYAALLRAPGGARFIDAVAEAREQAWREGGNTWAAYQCYGDPDWTFHPRGSGPRRGPSPAERYSAVSSPPQLTLALETLAVQCQVQGADRAAQALLVQHLASAFGPAWGAIGAVAEAFGLAWEAVGQRAQAIAWYQRAVAAEDGTASLQAAEQWANLLVKQAGEHSDAAPHPGQPLSSAAAAAAQAGLDQARPILQGLLQLRPSVVRHSLLGSLCKRQVMLHRALAKPVPGAEAQALAEMVAHYSHALVLARAAGAPGTAGTAGAAGVKAAGSARRPQAQAAGPRPERILPGLNLVAAHLAGRAPGSTVALPEGLVAELRAALALQSRHAPGFWCAAGLEELALYEALAAGPAPRRLRQLAQGFTALQARVASVGHWATVCDQMRFVLHPLLQDSQAGTPEGDAARQLLALLRGFAGRA